MSKTEKEENNELFQMANMGENVLIDVDDNPQEEGAAADGKAAEVTDVEEELQLDEDTGEVKVVTVPPKNETPEQKEARLAAEKQKIEQEKKDKGNAGGDDNAEVTPKKFSPFATVIKESGIIPTLDLEKMATLEKPEEQIQFLTESMEEYIETRVLEEAKSVSPEIEYLIKNYRKGVSLKEILDVQDFNFTVNSIKEADIRKTDDDAKALRADIMREYYRLTAPTMKKDKVDKIIADAQEKGEDIDESVTYLSEMKEMGRKEDEAMVQRAEKRKQDDAKSFEKWKTDIKGIIETTEEILPGIKLSKKEQEAVLNYLTKPVGKKKLPDGREIIMSKAMQVREEDPNLFDIRLNALIEKGYFSKNVDKNKILSKQKTAAVNELEKLLERTEDGKKTSKKETSENEEYAGFTTSLRKAVKK